MGKPSAPFPRMPPESPARIIDFITALCDPPPALARNVARETLSGKKKAMGSAAGPRRDFVRAAMQAPYLERDEEFDLAVRWREARDQAALHRLTQAHMRLVIAIAARFRMC